MFCTRCGSEIPSENSYCTSCGRKLYFTGNTSYYGQVSFTVPETREMVYPSMKARSPFLAFLLSFLLIGLGQTYVGQITKGVALFMVALVTGVLITPHIAVGIWLIGFIDAYRIARKLRQGYPVRQWEWF